GVLQLYGGGGGGGRISLQGSGVGSNVLLAPGPAGVTLNQGDQQVIGNLCATGTIGPCSDKRLKQNIRPIEGALEKIKQINGKNYKWNREEFPDFNFAEGNQIGVIAQEVKEVVPEAVSENNDGYLTVDYGRITAVLIEAVKEQQKQIEDLKAKVASLEKSPERAQLEK
ncbi:MAG: tail fiber domain-containing protein, partial [Candidatus Zixiibacteriota bacterium]